MGTIWGQIWQIGFYVKHEKLAEAHGNRTHQGRSSHPTPDLKSGGPTRTRPLPLAVHSTLFLKRSNILDRLHVLLSLFRV